MPVLDGVVEAGFQGCLELVVLCCTLDLVAPILVAEARQPYDVGIQRFGKMIFSALTMSCTQEFSLMGRRVMISEPAAMMMAMTAAVVGSMEYWNLAKV